MNVRLADARAATAALAAVGVATWVYARWLHVSNATTVALTYLLIILLTAASSRLMVAIAASGAALLCFNYFFLPPIGTWNIADPQNWVALGAFLTVSLVASRLSDRARQRTRDATVRRDELARLFDLSRDILLMTASVDALSILTRAIVRRFDLGVVAIALPEGDTWRVVQSGTEPIILDPRQLTSAYAAAQSSLEFDAYERTYAGHQTLTADDRVIRLVPLRAGTTAIGLLAASGRPIEAGTLDTLAGVVAIAIERAQFLEERKAAELARQREALTSALLAALGHDLRTPLTAIRVAATNIAAAPSSDAERREQRDVIVAEVERLTRLFDNVLQMARIDAGAVVTEPRWTHPSEIVAAARDQVAEALRQHPVAVDLAADLPVRLDPRLTATALAHALENAAQYSLPGARIDLTAGTIEGGVRIAVRDHGPGIQAKDAPHLFERFYRGDAGDTRPAGSGMGLWIARRLLAAQNGRIWVEHPDGGGAQFVVFVPAELQDPHATTSVAHTEDREAADDLSIENPAG